MRSNWGFWGVCLVFVAASACGKSKTDDVPIVMSTATAPPPPAGPNAAQQLALDVLAAPTWRDAFALSRPHVADVKNEESSGEILFAGWSGYHLAWTDIAVATNETSVAKVLKDPEAERGRRACASGTIIQIAVDRTMAPPVYLGLLMTEAGGLLRFLAVGETGDLVAQSNARFCGVVMGQFDYDNSGGGTGHAVAVVGMFDLPANRKHGNALPAAAPAPRAKATVAAAVPAAGSLAACCAAIAQTRARLAGTPEGARLDGVSLACTSGSVAGVRSAVAGLAVPPSCLDL